MAKAGKIMLTSKKLINKCDLKYTSNHAVGVSQSDVITPYLNEDQQTLSSCVCHDS